MNLKRFSLLLTFALGALLWPNASVHAQPYGAYASFSPSFGGHIRVPDSDSLDPTAAITIEGWFYLGSISSTAEDCRTLVGKDYLSDYWVGVCNSGSPLAPRLRSYLHGGTSRMDGGRLYLDKWNHFAVTWDGTTRRHYINGDLMLEQPDAAVRTPNDAELRIGSDVSWDHVPDGGLDEVRIWNVARTAAQIRSAINSPITSPQAGLVSVWDRTNDVVGTNDGAKIGDVRDSAYGGGTGSCSGSSPTSHCFGGRYTVTVDWRLPDGTAGVGRTVPGASTDSGLFYFFDPANWELLVKALDGCAINNEKWIFSAATTNVGYTLNVFDEHTSTFKRYINPLNVNAPAVNDTSAFPCP